MQQQPITTQSLGCTIDLGVLGSLYAQTWKELVLDVNRNSDDIGEEALLLLQGESTDVEAEFDKLFKEWRAARRATSSTIQLVMHPAYQRIIGMGKAALPLILRNLARETDHWFWALKAISGEDPVLPKYRGNMREMCGAWIRWGREKGYVR